MATSAVILQLNGKELTITHPDKLYWPDEGLTKIRMIEYYRDMAPIILPYLRDRPVTLRLFPRGINNVSFYRRDLPDNAPDWLRYCDYRLQRLRLHEQTRRWENGSRQRRSSRK